MAKVAKKSPVKKTAKETPAKAVSVKDTSKKLAKKTVKKAVKKPKPKKVKLTPEERDKKNFPKEIQKIFQKTGFVRVPSVSDKEFNFLSKYKSDFDDVFISDNIIVFAEYTTTQTSGISGHIKPKKLIYDVVLSKKNEFIKFYEESFPSFKEKRNELYDYDQTQVIILYCSYNDIEDVIKEQVPDVIYLEYPILKYFKAVTEAVKYSARFEMFKFLGLHYRDIGANVLAATSVDSKIIHGTILPESHSNFDPGFKVVSFYIDPETLLTLSYVLRKDGWGESGNLYQRMIAKNKINKIRTYLLKERRVFINNIIVTLPSETQTLNGQGKTVDPKELTKTAPVRISIPNEFNVIGLIDGQHRVFAYHEGGISDSEILKLRKKQNLLVTGIIYPEVISTSDKAKFEARLFLEINSNQTNARSDLKQAIGLILNPFTSDSIARAIVQRLNSKGPLATKFEKHFFERRKIKITSIVSYGLRPIVKLKGLDSFFYLWDNVKKTELEQHQNDKLLEEYLDFSVTQINTFIGAVKSLVSQEKWVVDNQNGILSTTTVNGLIICLRKLILNGKTGDFEYYKKRLASVDLFMFTKYKSSQYSKLGDDLYKKFFE